MAQRPSIPGRGSVLANAIALSLMTACGGSSPSAPSGSAPSGSVSSLPIVAGTYQIRFTPSDFVAVGTGLVMPGCPGLSTSGLRPATTEVDFVHDSGIWRARPRVPAGGSFELRFAPGSLAPGGPGGGPGVVATATGTVISSLAPVPSDPVPDSQLTFGDGATLTGGLSSNGRLGSGLVSGSLTFLNTSGTTLNCNSGTVNWFMNKIG